MEFVDGVTIPVTFSGKFGFGFARPLPVVMKVGINTIPVLKELAKGFTTSGFVVVPVSCVPVVVTVLFSWPGVIELLS